jgi:SDR family mycofactocin-dependent oxidoreductase
VTGAAGAAGAAVRVAVVTGAARGIGAAVVRRLSAQGWAVAAVDRCADEPGLPYPLATPEQLHALAAGCPGEVAAEQVDVRDADGLAEVVARAERRWGGVDAAVAAAAVIAGGAPLWETPAAQRDLLWSVDVAGVWNLAAATIPAMLRRPHPRTGRFVALASAAGHRGLWHLTAYNAAKHAVVGMIRGLAHDLRGTGIGAAAVSPGSTDTPMLAATARLYRLDPAAGYQDLLRDQEGDRPLDPDQVAAAVTWLCGPDGAAVSGTVIHADAGFTA